MQPPITGNNNSAVQLLSPAVENHQVPPTSIRHGLKMVKGRTARFAASFCAPLNIFKSVVKNTINGTAVKMYQCETRLQSRNATPATHGSAYQSLPVRTDLRTATEATPGTPVPATATMPATLKAPPVPTSPLPTEEISVVQLPVAPTIMLGQPLQQHLHNEFIKMVEADIDGISHIFCSGEDVNSDHPFLKKGLSDSEINQIGNDFKQRFKIEFLAAMEENAGVNLTSEDYDNTAYDAFSKIASNSEVGSHLGVYAGDVCRHHVITAFDVEAAKMDFLMLPAKPFKSTLPTIKTNAPNMIEALKPPEPTVTREMSFPAMSRETTETTEEFLPAVMRKKKSSRGIGSYLSSSSQTSAKTLLKSLLGKSKSVDISTPASGLAEQDAVRVRAHGVVHLSSNEVIQDSGRQAKENVQLLSTWQIPTSRPKP